MQCDGGVLARLRMEMARNTSGVRTFDLAHIGVGRTRMFQVRMGIPWKIVAAVLVVVSAFGLLSHLVRGVDRVHAADQSLRRVSEGALECRRREKDFLARFDGGDGVKHFVEDPHFIAHQTALHQVRRELAHLATLVSEDERRELARLRESIVAYDRSFHSLARAQAERGNSAHGAFAQWMRTGSALVLGAARDTAEASVPRWAQFLHEHHAYAAGPSRRVAESITAMLHDVEGLVSKQAGEIPSDVSEAWVAHRVAWAELVAVDRRIGWTPDEGLRGEMRAAIHRVQPAVDELVATIAEADEEGTHALVTAALVVAGGLGGLLWLALVFGARSRSAADALTQQNTALQQATAEAERANSVKSEFLAVMSHELRTPLNAVMGSASVLQRAPEMLPTLLPAILKAAEQQLALVNSVLELTGVSGNGRRDPVPFVPSKVAHEVLALQREVAESKGITVHVVTDDRAEQCVVGDVESVRRILASLINNAIKFTAEGSVRLRVTGEGVRDDDSCLTLEFAVIDTGVGVPEEARDRIFEPFVQADSTTTRRFDGAGVGLAVCRTLADRMGAELELVSELNRGTEVRLRCVLPMSDPAVLGPAEAVASQGPRMSLLPQVRVLVVDDGAANRLLMKSLLKTLNVHAELASDGEAAVAAHQQHAYDLILMDYHMPRMDGLEATRRIRKMEGRQPRIIGFTADVRSGTEARCREAGMAGFLTKPIKAEQLEAQFAEILAMPA